jgi:hypothetical protein
VAALHLPPGSRIDLELAGWDLWIDDLLDANDNIQWHGLFL